MMMEGRQAFIIFVLLCILPVYIAAHRYDGQWRGGRHAFSDIGIYPYPNYYNSWLSRPGFGNMFDVLNGVGSASWNSFSTPGLWNQWNGGWGNTWNANYPFDNIRAVQIPSVVDPITGVNTQFPLNSGLQGTAINSFPLGTVNQGIPISPLPGSTGVRPTLDGIGLPGLRSDTLWSRINTWKK